jgi:16S rRNA (adenine1518-N6/adenine1519-N6)-dimethyltransferase
VPEKISKPLSLRQTVPFSMSSARQTQTYLRRRFEEVGIKPEKRHGQNFLIDLNLLELLADTAEIQPRDVVLEVGTGTGALTAHLAAKAAQVISVEIDPRMHQLASEELIDHANISLLRQDILAGKNHLAPNVLEGIRAALAEEPHRRFKVAANLPYCVATPVISNLLIAEPIPATMTVTIQKELADRIVAAPHSKDYSALSIWVQCQCRAEIVRVLPPSVFWPRPQVDSAILQITFDPALRAAIANVHGFHGFVRDLFLYRRKHLRGALVTILKDRLDKPAIDTLLERLAFGEHARAEELSIGQMQELFTAVEAEFAERRT